MRSTKYEKLFANYLSDKWLVSKTYQECIQLNSKNHSVSSFNSKMGKGTEQGLLPKIHRRPADTSRAQCH